LHQCDQTTFLYSKVIRKLIFLGVKLSNLEFEYFKISIFFECDGRQIISEEGTLIFIGIIVHFISVFHLSLLNVLANIPFLHIHFQYGEFSNHMSQQELISTFLPIIIIRVFPFSKSKRSIQRFMISFTCKSLFIHQSMTKKW